MRLTVELELEDDGRWIAEVAELPGTLVYGASREDALHAAQALALRVLADKLEHGEAPVGEEIGPVMLSRIARKTGLKRTDL